jgi:hypothetical protein
MRFLFHAPKGTINVRYPTSEIHGQELLEGKKKPQNYKTNSVTKHSTYLMK